MWKFDDFYQLKNFYKLSAMNVNNTLIKIILIFFSLSSFVYSQMHDFRFAHLTSDNGLSQSSVTCIIQDRKGFMWFGTFNGLNRFDGYNFEVYNYDPGDIHSISHNYISSMCLDQQGNLWVGTSDGLNLYNYEINNFKSYKTLRDDSNSLSDNQIESILEDSKGSLWIGTRNGGLNVFDHKSETFECYYYDDNNRNSISSNRIGELFEDREGNLWVAHLNGIIDIIYKPENNSEKISIQRHKLSDFPITAIVESEDKSIWIGTQGGGLHKVRYQHGKLKQLALYSNKSQNSTALNSDIVLSLLIVNDFELWIGTENKGVNILDIEKDTFQYIQKDPFNESSLNHNSIWQIYKDKSENIWIGTYGYGLNLLTPGKSFIKHFKNQPGNKNSLSHNMVNSFVEDEDKNIWIATDGGGLNLFERQKNKFIHFDSHNSNIATDVIVSLLQDSHNRLWVGTWTDGLYLFDKYAKKIKQYTKEKNGLGSNRILHIIEDAKGGLWIATFYGGLTYFNPDNFTIQVYNSQNSDLSDNYVRVVLQDVENNLWIGTDSGLDYFNTSTKTFIHYKNELNNPKSISKGFVHSIVQSKDSTIWVGTPGGLNKLVQSSQEFVHYNTSNGLPNNEIKCILENNDGLLWLSTNKGISKFNPATKIFENYDVSDGLQGNEFNIRCGYITSENEIFFGGNNGFNIIDASIIIRNTYIPPIVIRDLKIFNKSVIIGGADSILTKHIGETKQITLSYDDAVFSFDFAALNYISPEKHQYAYKMEGFEKEWNFVGSKRTATYTNLDPGDYIFKVKASNNDGIWNEAGTSVKIKINPPFWKTWWAYLLETILVLTAVFFVINHFVSKQRLKNALKIEHLEFEKMYELDQMKTQFFSNISHEFHSPLTLILSPLEKLISYFNNDFNIQDSLKLIHRSAQRLQRMTNQLRDFQKLESGELQLTLSRGDIMFFLRETSHTFHDYAIDHHIVYQIKTEPERYLAWFDADILDKILYNLLSNAFKFTPDKGEISVDFSVAQADNIKHSSMPEELPNAYLEMKVSDSGIGIPEDKIENIFQRYYRGDTKNDEKYLGSGVGLAFVYELIQMYQGDISVESKNDKGAIFKIQIPLDENYLEEKQLVSEFKTSLDNDPKFSGLHVVNKMEQDDNEGAIGEISEENMPVLLIVEDDKEILSYIKSSFELNYRVYCAENGSEGINKATKIIPDIIVSDIKMPEITGIQLCNQLKEDERTSHIPIILLTAYTSREIKIEGLIQGADAYVSKPFNIDELEAQIHNLLETRKRLKDKYSRQIFLEPMKLEITNIDEKFLQRIMETIESRISDSKFNAEKLSRDIGLSRMQLYRKLRGLTGQTVHEFIRNIKLKRAVQLLKEKKMTITEVAYEVGFNDLTYFARCFRKQYKKSPSEFISEKN